MEIIIILVLLALYILIGLKKPPVALITSPFVAGTLIVVGAVKVSPIVIAGGPVLFFVTLISVLFSKQEPESENWPKLCVKWFFIVIVIPVFSLLFIIMGFMAAPFGTFCVIFFGLTIGSIIIYFFTSRTVTSAHIISTIGSSVRQNLPLPMALESAAIGRDKRSRILLNIKKWLVQGYSLSESIKRGYPKCPGYAVAMIATAERIHQVPSALKAIEANIAAQTREKRKIRPVHPIYPVIVITLMFFIILALMSFVIPTYDAVLQEFFEDQNLPVATRVVLGMTRFLVFDYGWLVGILLLLTIIFVIPSFIYFKFRPRRPDSPYLLSRIGDFIKWHLPVLHWFEKNYSMVQVTGMLRLSLNAGCPVNDAIKNTISLDVNNCFKKRLIKWHQKVERGDNIAVAARSSKLGSPLAWAFDEKVNQGNTLAILETLEAFYRSNYSYRVNLARFIIWPCVILCMGAVVGFMVIAVYMPGVAIINNLVTTTIP
ncbi:MAG: type II secretion system F family protein [Sedimentisphaerales bacterium]|nr:type II secretion system F family protein [Sedimentisphaerales bacterium]